MGAEPEAYYGAIGYGYGAAVPSTGLPVQPLVPAGPWGALVPRKTPAVEAAEADHFLPLASVRPTLMPTTVMVPTPLDMGLAMAMAVLATAMARGLLTPRLMRTMATEAMVDMVLATPLATVLAMAMVVMARGQLTLRPMPTMAMVDTDSVMADTAMVVLATAMVKGLLMPRLTMDTVELTPDTDMVDTDLVLAMATASKQ